MTTALIKPYPEHMKLKQLPSSKDSGYYSQFGVWIIAMLSKEWRYSCHGVLGIAAGHFSDMLHSSQSSFLHVVNEGPEVSFYDPFCLPVGLRLVRGRKAQVHP